MKLKKTFPLIVAAALQVMPMVRTALPQLQAAAPSSWAVVLRLGAGAIALFGYHAVSSASSIAISPANATVGTPYTGTITYSGGHAGSVSSMAITNLCMTSTRTLLPGLTTLYNSVNTASVSGTPTTAGTFTFSIRMYDGGCGSGDNDLRSTSLVVQPPLVTNVAPAIVAAPQNVTAQAGSDVIFSAGATGNPVPKYYWYLGLPTAANLIGTNSSLTLTNIPFSKAGLYTVTASNVAGAVSATAYLSACSTAGSNTLTLDYTNYVTVSNQVVLTSFLTNTAGGSNVYKWQFNHGDITTYATNGSNYTVTAANATAAHSGIYTVVFKSTVAGNVIVPDEAYDSYWAFGAVAKINAAPTDTNVTAGANVTLPVTATVQQNPYGNNLPLTFLWYQNGNNLVSSQTSVGTNQSTGLTLNSVAATNAGTYTVVVTNYWGAITSSPAILTVGPVGTPPGFSAQPSSKAVLAGQNVNFGVTATGTAPLGYQWQINGSSLSNSGVISGVNTNVLTLTGVTGGNAGSYSVVVTNIAGTNTSSSAVLTVASPPSLSLSPLGSGNLQLSATTVTGLTYIVQSTTNLTVWTPLTTNVVPANGQVMVTNSSLGSEFFRLLFP